MARQEGRGLQQAGNVDLSPFINGNPSFGGESLFAVGWWLSTSLDGHREIRFQGTSLPPSGIAPGAHVDYEKGSVTIDASHVFLSKWYFEKCYQCIVSIPSSEHPFLKTEYEFSLTTSTNDYVETFRPSGAAPISHIGRCTTYK